MTDDKDDGIAQSIAWGKLSGVSMGTRIAERPCAICAAEVASGQEDLSEISEQFKALAKKYNVSVVTTLEHRGAKLRGH